MATNASRPITRGRRAQILAGIYVILNESPQLLELAEAVLHAGVRLVQYRAKSGIDAESLRALREITKSFEAVLILNDDWRAADRFDCDGVHLGPDDDGFEDAPLVRAALSERLIGLSCGTLDEVRRANDANVDYIGVGSVYATPSKENAGAPIGLARLRELAGASAVPVAAIGGITLESIPGIRASGAAMAAVISAVSNSADPRRAASELLKAWHR